MGVTVGNRMITISAREDPEDPRQLVQGGAHAEAADPFWARSSPSAGATGVWSAEP